jgi:hypothetical protein
MPSKKMLKDAELSEESVLDSFDSDVFHQHVNRTDSYKAQRSNIQGFPRGMSRLTRNSSSETTLLCFQTFNFMLDPYEIKPSQSQPALFLWFQKLIVNNCCQALEPLLKPFGFV